MDDLEFQIKLGELNARLQAQVQSKMTVEVEMLRLQKRTRDYQVTLKNLMTEITKTNNMIKDLKDSQPKGGE